MELLLKISRKRWNTLEVNNDCYKVKIGVVKVRHSNVDIFREQKLGSRNILVKLVKEYASGKLYRDTQNS